MRHVRLNGKLHFVCHAQKLLAEGKTIQEQLLKDSAKNQTTGKKTTLLALFMEEK